MTVFIGFGERGSRFLTDQLRLMDNTGIIAATQAADGTHIVKTANDDLLRVGYTDSDEQIIAEVEQLVNGDLFDVLRESREVVDLEGAAMNRRTGKQYIETNENLARFITEKLEVTGRNPGPVKIFASLYGGTGSGAIDWVVEHIDQGDFLGSDIPTRPEIVLDVGLPMLKTDNQPVRTEDGAIVTRYDDLLDQLAELEAYAACGTVTALTPKDNGLGLIAEMAHRNNMSLDQLRSIAGPIRNDEFNWTAAADFLDTKVELPADTGVGVLNTGHLRAGGISLMLQFDGSLDFRDPQGALRDRGDILSMLTHNTAVVDSQAEVNREQAVDDESHLERSIEHSVISATKRAVNKPIAGYSIEDVNMVQAFVATVDGTPLNYLPAAERALVSEFGRDEFYITTTAVENVHEGHFVDGEKPDAAVWLRVGVDTVLSAYEELDNQI